MRLIISILALLFVLPIQAQDEAPNLLFKQLDYKNGLTDPNVQAFLSDHFGFLWIGTHNGLNRFDGINCVSFSTHNDSTKNLEGNILSGFFQNRNGDIWMGTQKGLSRYDYIKGRFIYKPFKNATYYYANPFYENEKLWANISGGIYVIDSTFHFLTDKTNGKSFVSQNKKLDWFISNASNWGLFVHYVDKHRIIKSVPFFRDSVKLQISDVWIENEVWIASSLGLIKLNVHTADYEIFKIKGGANCLYFHKEKIYVGTNTEGLAIFDIKKKQFVKNYKHEFNNIYSLAGNQVVKILIDKKDNIFLGIAGKGVSYANLNQVIFDHVLTKNYADTNQVDNNISSILQTSSGLIWCSTLHNGILIFDKDLNKIVDHKFKGEKIYKLLKFSENEILIDRGGPTKYIFDLNTSKLKSIDFNTIPHGITDGIIDPINKKFLGISQVGAFEIQSKIRFLDQLNSSIEWKNISHMVFVNENEALVQTFYTNLYLVKRTENDFQVIREIARTPFNISSSVKIDNDIYLATTSGLIQYKDGFLNPIREVNAYCTDIEYDGNGKIWLNSNSGLHSYNIYTKEVEQFRESDGLQGAIFASNTLIRLQNGKMITGGANGINIFDPQKIKRIKAPTKVVISEIKINDITYEKFNPLVVNGLTLNFKHNTVSFKISALDFINGAEKKLNYQLVGFDVEPLVSQGSPEIRYARLPAGNYIFRINAEGSPFLKEINLVIKPPFWQTYWFIILMILLFVFLGLLGIYLFGKWVKNNQLKKIRIMLSSQEEERKRIAIDLHDDLGGRLSSLKLYMQAGAKKANESDKKNLKYIISLLDDAISELRNTLFNLSPKSIEENGLEAALKDLAFNIEKITQLKIETNIELNNLKIGKFTEYSIYRICQELLNNTLKHSQASKVILSLISREDGLVFLYEDNGKGFDINLQKEGYGLTNIKTHAQAINSLINIDSKVGFGTAVTVHVPKTAIAMEGGFQFLNSNNDKNSFGRRS